MNPRTVRRALHNWFSTVRSDRFMPIAMSSADLSSKRANTYIIRRRSGRAFTHFASNRAISRATIIASVVWSTMFAATLMSSFTTARTR